MRSDKIPTVITRCTNKSCKWRENCIRSDETNVDENTPYEKYRFYKETGCLDAILYKAPDE